MAAQSSTHSRDDDKQLKVEVLYFDGCPNVKPTMDNLADVIRESGISVSLEPIAINGDEEAHAMRFLGSPSVRMGGRDVELNEELTIQYSMRCRMYETDGRTQGFPSKSLLRLALKRAVESHG